VTGVQTCVPISGSLRDAITQANSSGGPDTIAFAIASGVQTIVPLSSLPVITGATTIDGSTQPGTGADPLIVIAGVSLGGDGLSLNGHHSVVRNLVVNGFAGGAGIRLGGSADNSTVANCFVGTGSDGVTAIPNGVGVAVGAGCANAVIGDGTPAAPNRIIGNLSHGVDLDPAAGAGNRIRGNTFAGNGGLGINLGGGSENLNGVTANDPGDADTGANNLQNYPVLANARSFNFNGNGRVTGSLNSTPNTTYAVEVFATDTTDGSGNAEGGSLLGAVDVTTNAQGDASFALDYTPIPGQGVLTATATGPAGSTSEFAAPVVQTQNNAPLGNTDFYTTDEDVPFTVDAAAGVLGNDSDLDGDPLTASLLNPPFAGAVQLNADGSFTYTPNPDYNGNDGFTYEVSDGQSTSVGNVSLNVNSIPDAGKFAFSASEFFATEQSGFGIVTVVRDGGTEGVVSVDYTLTPGTATAFDDYAPFDGSLTFFPGDPVFGQAVKSKITDKNKIM
jgi:hypothetical protein